MEVKEQVEERKRKRKRDCYWMWMIASLILRLILLYFPRNLNLLSRPEVSTPLTSIRRLAEGYWLKHSSMSPYGGSMYHGSPLLLSIIGPLTVNRVEGQPNYFLCSFVFLVADILIAFLIRTVGRNLQTAYNQSLESLELHELSKKILPAGDIASLVYLRNPFTIFACVGLSTSPIENLTVILSLYGACTRRVPLAAFGWVMATHMSLYPIVLFLGNGSDAPPKKLFYKLTKIGEISSRDSCDQEDHMNQQNLPNVFDWRPILHFLFWVSLWSIYVLVLCLFGNQHGGLWEMSRSNLGHAEVISFCWRSCFVLEFISLFVNELTEMKFSFFLFWGYIGVSLLSPVMQNLWIWRGTGNENFYFATAMAYACLQIILVIESVSAMVNHDRKLQKLYASKLQQTKSILVYLLAIHNVGTRNAAGF